MTTQEETQNEMTESEELIDFEEFGTKSEEGSSSNSNESMKDSDDKDHVQEVYHIKMNKGEENDPMKTDKGKPQIDVNHMFQTLQKQVQFFRNRSELKIIEKYEKDLQRKLGRELQELDFTMKETSAAVENILRMKKQRYYVKKELSKMTKNLNKIKQEETKEMELVVAVYDKELLRRWHLLKKSNSPHSIEAFLNNVIGKRQSIDIVYKMAKEKLETLKKKGATSNFPALSDKTINEEERVRAEDSPFEE